MVDMDFAGKESLPLHFGIFHLGRLKDVEHLEQGNDFAQKSIEKMTVLSGMAIYQSKRDFVSKGKRIPLENLWRLLQNGPGRQLLEVDWELIAFQPKYSMMMSQSQSIVS